MKTDKNKLNEEIKRLTDFIKANPGDAHAYFDRGNCKDDLEDYQGAIDDYTKAIELDPKHADAYHNRGVSKDELGDHQGAIDDYTKVIEINPNYANAYYNRGNSKHKLRDYQGAIKDYTKAIEIDPSDARAYYNRANSKHELRDYQGAIEDFTKTIEIDPKYAKAYCNRGFSKAESGDHQGAIEDSDKAIWIDKNDARPYHIRGFGKYKLRDYQGAIEDCTQAIKLYLENPKIYSKNQLAKVYFNRGVTYKKLGQEDKAIEDFKLAQEIDPTIVAQEISKDTNRRSEEAEDFQKILDDALTKYEDNSEVWLNASIVATVIVAGILICLAICNDAKQDAFDMGRITLNIFILTILFLIIRQYSNAKKLAIETNNRLIASKLFNNVKNSDDDDIKPEVKETAYPKIIDAIVDSPYNQAHEDKSDNIVDKIINAWPKK